MMIEMAARRLGQTAVVDAFEERGYNAPSLEDDMDWASEWWFGPNHTKKVQEVIDSAT